MPLAPPISNLLKRFHARKPARIWSLIVTLYGDAIVPRGGSLWIGSLIEIMALFRIDAGHVRTAVSRLSSDGWLASTKRGRASYYRLSRSGADDFLQATQRIYSAVPVRQGDLFVAAIGPAAGDVASLRSELKAAGYAPISPSIHAGLGELPEMLRHREGLYFLTPRAGDRHAIAATAFSIPDISKAYAEFITEFASLAAWLRASAPSDEEALIARTLLIHDFRRVVLRDPGLPLDLLPRGWNGEAARALAGEIYAQVVPGSERFLEAHGRDHSGPLPQPGAAFHKRFSR
ncbi:MAG: PaaX family transcriptional regulator C-terminal domain-containing protein [Pseudorhodoplanes sp.]